MLETAGGISSLCPLSPGVQKLKLGKVGLSQCFPILLKHWTNLEGMVEQRAPSPEAHLAGLDDTGAA